jgi:hypothetical protein
MNTLRACCRYDWAVTVHPDDHPDDLRPVDLFDEGLPVLPDQTSDDTDLGWGDWRSGDSDSRYLDERPPHWG